MNLYVNRNTWQISQCSAGLRSGYSRSQKMIHTIFLLANQLGAYLKWIRRSLIVYLCFYLHSSPAYQCFHSVFLTHLFHLPSVCCRVRQDGGPASVGADRIQLCAALLCCVWLWKRKPGSHICECDRTGISFSYDMTCRRTWLHLYSFLSSTGGAGNVFTLCLYASALLWTEYCQHNSVTTVKIQSWKLRCAVEINMKALFKAFCCLSKVAGTSEVGIG